MNNEIIKSPKISKAVSTTSSINNINYYPANSSNSSTTTITSYSSKPSPLSLPVSSSSTSLSCSTSAKFDVAVNAIAAVVNASNHLPLTTPPKAAAVVAVAVSSLAAAIFPDTPIVSIAGSTLSEITTTTTSTKTTPTPVPTSKETGSSNNNTPGSNSNKNSNNKELENRTSPLSPFSKLHLSSLSYSTSRASVKGFNPMSVVNSSNKGALTNASSTAANDAAAEIDNSTFTKQATKDISISNAGNELSTTCGFKSELLTTIETKSITTATTTPNSTQSIQPVVAYASVSASKSDDINVVTPNESKSKDFLSESWEESRLKDWDDSKLKELLDEAYSYKNPRDKENKSKTFLQLLEKAENEDQSYPFRVTTRGPRNLSSSITSNSYHYQQNPHYNSHSHSHNRSHHQHKQGGSLQDLFEIGLHESQLDCEQAFGIGIGGNQRTRRQNHNSRQKKYSSSVSSRQREGGSLPSNVNVTYQLSVDGSGVINDISLILQDSGTLGTATITSKANKKEQRRSASKAASTTTAVSTELKDKNSISSVEETFTTSDNTTANANTAYTASGGDFIIDMGEPMMDIQQQQKILQCKGQDATTQGHPFYERLANNDKRIPRANIGSKKGTNFAPTNSHCYIDETVRFNALERNIGTNIESTSSTIDAKFLPLDENYKSCKSVFGSDGGDKSPEMLVKSNTIYTKVSSPASGSAIFSGNTNNITTLTQRQLDENGNALSELYQNSTGAGSNTGATIQINAVSPTAANASAALLNSCGNVSTSATVTISPHTASSTVSTSATVTTFTSGPSQAKAKAKKKSQQDRNTKNLDVESVAGYRGKDPVEELVKYIESSGEDKQSGSGSKTGEKKKERKKDKEKHRKLKKSNSLEELRSGAKMEVHELKRTAATTESNAVLVRQKSGGGASGKQNKNNSSSTADINKNLENRNSTNSRKSDRRSWGNEDLKYMEDQQNSNLISDEKTTTNAAANPVKERKIKVAPAGTAGMNLTTSAKEEKEIKDKTIERNERNLTNNITPTATIHIEKSDKVEKPEKSEKFDKSEKCEKTENKSDKLEKRKKQDIPPNAVTVVDILAIESVLPETAEFHVVTKKKKPKKQKVVNNLEETTVTFNRTHNFTMQKTSTFNQQQQQMTVRYKYYHHDNTSFNTGISNTNTNTTNSQNHQNATSQQQQQHQQQHYPTTENYTNTTDKSRRKSTSSVPPSEKSDSSDLDSVHSLPVESSKSNNSNVVAATSSNATNKGGNVQQKSKGAKNNPNSVLGKHHNSPAPISYADIARTNKEIADAAAASASGILTNNNEISTECRNADALAHNAINATESVNSDDKLAVTVISAATMPSTTSTAATKLHKIKKSHIKQDFPELAGTSVYNDDKIPSTNVNYKTITYSQSLTAVANPTQNSIPTQSQRSGGGGDGGSNLSSDYSPSSPLDANAKASSTDHYKNLIVHQHAHIPPLQHPQQQVLQKSKSVENDFITTSMNSSLSSTTHVASLNSNNLDQQYPALEKTVKRHSSTNVTMIGATTSANSHNMTPFNFAAAAKQQTSTNVSSLDQNNINLNKNSALTTSNTNSNTIQAGLISSSTCSSTVCGNTVNNINKKSKEKSPPLTLTATTQHVTQDNNEVSTNITTLTTTPNSKKSKKERQQLQQSLLDSCQTKLSQNNSTSNSGSNKKPLKAQLKSTNSLPLGLATSASSLSLTAISGGSNLTSVNRPAVIILNDDRNSASSAADNQFTFGDFNEEELKLFDDDNNSAAPVAAENLMVDTIDIIAVQTVDEKEKQEPTAGSSSSSVAGVNAVTYFNDSGASCSNDLVNNSTSDMLLSSSIDASSPNTSFVVHSHCNSGPEANHMPTLSNNQSRDSGIYSDKTKSSNNSCSSSSSSGGGGGGVSSNVAVIAKHKEQMSPTNVDNNKLNTFLSKTNCASVHTSMDNLDPQLPPPQQLETCNDIETAIIAAARAAAKQHKPSQQQQQQYRNSNNSSNSSSFSSSSISSTTTSYRHKQTHHQHQIQHQHQHHNCNINSNVKYQNQNVSSSGTNSMPYYHSEYDEVQDDNDDEDDDDDSFATNTPRSRSPSRPRRISIAGGTVANKEFDIHFIPPTTMPTAFSTQQHNDIIIDFIGSAWEEVANSKVTKVYDGQ